MSSCCSVLRLLSENGKWVSVSLSSSLETCSQQSCLKLWGRLPSCTSSTPSSLSLPLWGTQYKHFKIRVSFPIKELVSALQGQGKSKAQKIQMKWGLLRGEKAMAPHSRTLAWKIPWMEEPGRLQSMGSLRVGHDWATSLSLFTFMLWRRKWQPTPGFLPGESQGLGSLVGCPLWGCTESDTTEAT